MAEEDESGESEDDPEDEPDAEEIREQAKKKARQAKKAPAKAPAPAAARKPPQKKPKTNGITLPIRGVTKAAPKKRPAKRTKAVDAEEAEAMGGLYAELFARGQNADEVVAGWLKAFEEHESRALADFISFVLHAAGCKSKVTEEDIEDPDGATARLTELQDEHHATNPTEYPLAGKSAKAMSFKTAITDFVFTLIKAISAADLFKTSPELLENIQVWLSTMSSATERSFRHTATVVSLSLITALCEIARELAEKGATSQRQAEMEKKKKTVNKARVKEIEQKVRDATAEQEYANSMLKDWFDTVFIHRYRDVDHLIRRDCIEALGDWIVAMPETFFDGAHLRYLGWLLSDENAQTRQEAVKQLRRLYADSDKLGGLKTFTERFRSRLVEIGTSDADVAVRVTGIELLGALRENDLLEPDDIDAIGRLAFHEEPKVRKAVAGFFAANVKDLFDSKVEDVGGAEILEESLPAVGEGNYEAPRLEWLSYKSLAETLRTYDEQEPSSSQFERNRADGTLFLNATGTESRFTIAVEELYGKIDALKHWQSLAGYLLFDHSSNRSNGVGNDPVSQLKHESVLTEAEELILLEVLNATVKRSFSDLAEEHATHKGKLTKKQKEDMQEELEEAIRNLTELIPKLLKKFGDTPSTAAAVIRLEGVLALPALRSQRHDAAVNGALLDDLRKQFMSHGSDEVLGPATAAILHAQSYGDLDESALEKVSSLWEDVVSNLAELLNIETLTVRGASTQEELVALSNNLLRIVRLATVSNCIAPLEDSNVAAENKASGKKWNGAIDFIIDLIERAQHSTGPSPDPEEAALEDLVAARAAEASLFYFRWKFLILVDAIRSRSKTQLSFDKLEPLAERRDAFMDQMVKVLDGRKANEEVCFVMSRSLLDLYISAAVLRTEEVKTGVPDDFTVLIMELEPEHQRAVLKVFGALEKDFARLSGKTLDKPAQEDEDVDVDADPIDDDPLSEPDDDEDDADTQASQQARDARLAKPLIAEQKLCQLTSKIIHALIAGVIEDQSTRKRLVRNKTKLGANFKAVLEYLNASTLEKKQAKAKAKSKGNTNPAAAANTKKGKVNPKSNAIVAEDEVDDEIEDDDDHEAEPEEPMDHANGSPAAAEEVESVVGD
ncbi:uncharacterized protein MYCFIDRAFT_81862 [Pseudocercospora fijiensis CIRAD86]|uniref:SCD domain-containing protein n=1 Tax=Pseudocercospora fijiensis (strain CIRAD86) TaxID=383855 RepID=M3B9F9_PSEFD|nr:uncharacterized protein MYCFIDRAFT_81862 [Pseudocercospora fijiensis CIRAD86]EME85893.1 hypothetical protein MYCFIDRAFT_81862 [Pseudocercospora fijiensis CIRAD86]